MCPFQNAGRLSHRFHIERLSKLPHVPSLEYILETSDADAVAVPFPRGRKARMEILRCFLQRHDADIIRKSTVQFIHQLIGRYLEWQAEIGTLPLGMYARIRSTGPIHLADLPCHLKKRILDLSLNGFLRAGLFLPSFIARPVIGHDHCIVCHIYSFPEPHAPLYSLYTEKASEKRKSDSKPMNNFEKTSKSPLKPLLPLTRRTRLHSRSKTG